MLRYQGDGQLTEQANGAKLAPVKDASSLILTP